MPPGRRPELHVSTLEPPTQTPNLRGSSAHTATPRAPPDTPLNMATELRLPSPAIFSPHMPSPRVQLPPIFPHPPASMIDTPATLPRRDCSQAYAMSSRYGSPYARPPSLSSSRLGPAVPAEVPPTQSPARSLSSYSPSLVPSVSSPRNFELPLDRKRSFDQALSDRDRHVGPTVDPANDMLTLYSGHREMLHAHWLRYEEKG